MDKKPTTLLEHRKVGRTFISEQDDIQNSIDKSPYGIQIFKFDGELIYINSTMLGIWGYDSFKELKNIPLQQRLTPESIVLIDELNDLCKQENTAPEHNITVIRKDGHLRILHGYCTDIIWNGERYVQVLYEDVTEKQHIEGRLKKEQENFRNSIENSPLGIQIVRWNGELVYANRTMLDIWGYGSVEELKNIPMEQRFTPDSLALLRERRERIGNGEITLTDEFTIIRKDGRLRILRAYHKEIIWNDEECGQVLYEDITEKKQIEERLKKEQDNFRNSLEMSPLGVQIVDSNGELVYANKTMLNIWGYDNFVELKAVPIHLRFTPESLLTINCRKVWHSEGVFESYELVAVCRDGEKKALLAYPKEIIWDGQLQVQILYQDISGRKKAEEELRFSNAAFQSIHEGVFAMDNNFIVTHWNSICEKMFGIKAVDAIGKSVRDVISIVESYPGQNVDRINLMITKGYHEDVQLYRTPKGEVWVDIHAQAIESGGIRYGWVTLAADITERKQVEDALMFKTTLLEAQAENTDEGILVINDHYKPIFGNKRFRDMWQISYDVIQGEGDTQFVNQIALQVKDPDQFTKRIRQINENNEEKSEDLIELKDGRIFDRYSSPMIDANGLYRGRAYYYRDVTEPRRMRDKIERAAEEWRITFDSITDRISIHDKENRLLRVNKAYAAKFGLAPRDIIGKTCNQLAHGIDGLPKNCPWAQTLRTGKPSTVEVFQPDIGLWVQESASPVFGNNGEVIGTVNIIKDVTEFRQMEQRLIMTDRLASIGELVAGIAHELNNPLTGVIGFSQLLMEKDVSDDIKEDLMVVFGEAQRAARIVRDLLTFARKHAPVKQPSQINNILEDVLRLRAYEQKVNNIEVITHLNENNPEIMVDYFQMQQVFLNIIINAEYFMINAHKRGTLTVSTEVVKGLVRITFSDDGPGIPPENIKKVFDPFFTTKEVGKGTGLGLSICHGIVTEHGGQMYAKSGRGKGATFIIDLPLER
jgi:PAS domain S-box-containing protein